MDKTDKLTGHGSMALKDEEIMSWEWFVFYNRHLADWHNKMFCQKEV